MPTDLKSGQGKRFDPFESRQCRTVRNALGQNLLSALPTGGMAGISRAAQKHFPATGGEAIHGYVTARLKSYRAVFNSVRSTGTQVADTWFITRLLWNQELFFECHEWLEKKWHRSEGAEKKMIQVLIWAAGAYSQLEYGRSDAAGKLAARAIVGLRQYREQVPELFDVDLLVRKLETLDPVPPKFSSGQQPV